jgi:predicted nucleotidyltransferase
MIEYPVQVTESLLQEITRRIVEGFNPEKVILFGSQASGASRADSDIDLLVIMDSQLSALQRAVAVKRVCRSRFVSMDVFVKTPEDGISRTPRRVWWSQGKRSTISGR